MTDDGAADVIEPAQRAQANTEILDLVLSFVVSRAICAAVELGIADLLSDGPRTAEELAAATGTRPDLLFRLLRVLATRGVFEQRDDGEFAINMLAEPLRRDALGGSAHGYAMYVGTPFAQRPWEKLVSTLRTGQPAFPAFHGRSLFDYLAADGEANALFNDAMSSHTSRDADAVVAAYDFSGRQTVIDIGGGHGALLAAILAANPDARGVLLERPSVLSGAQELLGALGASDRCRLVEGDMFESVPAAGDIYVLKRVIHDWKDDEARLILENCRRAMSPSGRVLVIDMLVPPGADGQLAKLYDLMMMVYAGGRERTESEFDDLFASAGLRLTRSIPTGCPLCLMEGVRG